MEKTKKTDTEPFVSVLTPVYNGEEFLRECIESVLNQNYENWEYVLVNNQSTDGTLDIIEEYAEEDNRIRIHNNDEFLPQMENLNHAFRQISPNSKYCKVLHADDWLFPDCLLKMVEVTEEYPTVGIVSAYRLTNKRVELDGLSHSRNFISGREIARKFLLDDISHFRPPSALLLRSDLIRERDEVYDESYLSSDTGTCLELLKESDFGFVHQVLTFTRVHENSVTNTLAEQAFASLYGEIKFQLEYGPYFLSEEELKNRLSKKIDLYHDILAGNLIQNKSKDRFKRQLEILSSFDLKFKTGKFLEYLIKRLIFQMFNLFGLKIKKAKK